MDKATVSFDSFTHGCREEKEVSLSDPIHAVAVFYDGGRLNISINGTDVLNTALAGIDFAIIVRKS